MSLYDLDTPAVRKGISGWKLTKRPMASDGDEFVMPPQPTVYPGTLEIGSNINRNRKKSKKTKHSTR